MGRQSPPTTRCHLSDYTFSPVFFHITVTSTSPPMIIQSLPFAFLLGDATMMDLFIKGKEIMWPILLLSFVAITVVIERLLFIIRENASREPEVVEKMLEAVERRDTD